MPVMNRKPPGGRGNLTIKVKPIAFSLIEVTLAIGIVSFAVLAILGTLAAGLRSSRESSEDTVLALATQEVNAWSRSQPFPLLAAAAKTSSSFLIYFNADGTLVRTADGLPSFVPAPDAFYGCTISVHTSGVSDNLLLLQYRFEWPLVAPATARQKEIVTASRSNED